MLYIAGLLLLVHNFVPHYHQQTTPIGSSHQTLEVHHNQDHHGSMHHSHENDSDDQQEADNPFNVPQHSQTVGNAIVKSNCNSIAIGNVHYLAQEYFDLTPMVFTLSQKNHYRRGISNLLKSQHFSSNTFRGPPYLALS